MKISLLEKSIIPHYIKREAEETVKKLTDLYKNYTVYGSTVLNVAPF